MKQYVEEKTGGCIPAVDVHALSLATIRKTGPAGVCDWLMGLPRGVIVVVNALSEADVTVVAAGVLRAEAKGYRMLLRTAASYVSARLAIPSSPPLLPQQLVPTFRSNNDHFLTTGYIMVVMILGNWYDHSRIEGDLPS